MATVDINCDMGESSGNDKELMPFISSANISCGFHAGDGNTINETLILCRRNKVAIGAHPSFPDRENFGRKEIDASPDQIFDWVFAQVLVLKNMAENKKSRLHHVKPHGALYNKAAIHKETAKAIVSAICEVDKNLVLYGLSGSKLITEAKNRGLRTANEVFADRTYQNDGTLTPRSEKGALIEDEEKSLQQVLHMIEKGKVITLSGAEIPIEADTICIHGDGKHAVDFARRIFSSLKKRSIDIQTI